MMNLAPLCTGFDWFLIAVAVQVLFSTGFAAAVLWRVWNHTVYKLRLPLQKRLSVAGLAAAVLTAVFLLIEGVQRGLGGLS